MQVLRRKHTTRTLTPAILGRSLAVIAVAFALVAPAIAPAPAHASSSVRVMVDPGHGGKDPGAVGPGLQEKNSSLQISRYVAESARRQGWDVAMTRNSDKFIDLNERPRAATRFKATATVSMHSNSTGAASKGMMTIHRGASSARLGNAIMSELAPQTPYGDIGNRSDVRGLAVLRGATNPTVIVELLSVTSRHENAALRDPVRQRQMAEAVVKGLAKFHNVKYYPPAAPKAPAKPAPAKPAAPATKTAAPAAPAKPEAAPAPKAAPKAEPKAAPVKPKTEPTEAPKVQPKKDAPKSELSNPTERKAEPVRKAGPKPGTVAMWGLSTVITLLFR